MRRKWAAGLAGKRFVSRLLLEGWQAKKNIFFCIYLIMCVPLLIIGLLKTVV